MSRRAALGRVLPFVATCRRGAARACAIGGRKMRSWIRRRALTGTVSFCLLASVVACPPTSAHAVSSISIAADLDSADAVPLGYLPAPESYGPFQVAEILELSDELQLLDGSVSAGEALVSSGLPRDPLTHIEGFVYGFGNYLHVVGIVGNPTSKAYNFVQVTCEFLDGAGRVLHTEQKFATEYRLAPGEHVSFKSMVYWPEAPIEGLWARASATGVPEVSRTPVRLTLVSESVWVSLGARNYSLVFRNDSMYTVEQPRVGGWEWDSSGSVVDTLFGADFSTQIPPGGTWSVEVNGFNQGASVQGYYVQCQAQRVVAGAGGAISVAGQNRVETAIRASRLAFGPGSVDTVVIATGQNWPDALGGTALAGAVDGPVLLVSTDSLPGSVATEIARLGANRAIILGGTSAVGRKVETALNNHPSIKKVERIAGNDRYQTADRVALRVIKGMGSDYDGMAFVATGENFPDALAAAPLAAAKGWPLFLANPARGLSASTRSAMAAVQEAVILGGTAVVPQATQDTIGAMSGKTTRRLQGPDRYGTAVAVANYAVTHHWHTWERVGITTGVNFPDALAGGVLQGKADSVMLLTSPERLNPRTASALRSHSLKIDTVTFFGGNAAVSSSVRGAVDSIIK